MKMVYVDSKKMTTFGIDRKFGLRCVMVCVYVCVCRGDLNLSFENFFRMRSALSWGTDAQIPGPKSAKFRTLAPNICGPQCGTCFIF